MKILMFDHYLMLRGVITWLLIIYLWKQLLRPKGEEISNFIVLDENDEIEFHDVENLNDIKYLKLGDPDKQTKTFNTLKEYEGWKQGNMDWIEGKIRLDIVRDKDRNIRSSTASYKLKTARAG